MSVPHEFPCSSRCSAACLCASQHLCPFTVRASCSSLKMWTYRPHHRAFASCQHRKRRCTHAARRGPIISGNPGISSSIKVDGAGYDLKAYTKAVHPHAVHSLDGPKNIQVHTQKLCTRTKNSPSTYWHATDASTPATRSQPTHITAPVHHRLCPNRRVSVGKHNRPAAQGLRGDHCEFTRIHLNVSDFNERKIRQLRWCGTERYRRSVDSSVD